MPLALSISIIIDIARFLIDRHFCSFSFIGSFLGYHTTCWKATKAMLVIGLLYSFRKTISNSSADSNYTLSRVQFPQKTTHKNRLSSFDGIEEESECGSPRKLLPEVIYKPLVKRLQLAFPSPSAFSKGKTSKFVKMFVEIKIKHHLLVLTKYIH